MKKILFTILVMGITINLSADLATSANTKVSNNVELINPKQIKIFTKPCENGSAKGCFDLGYLYNMGKGIKKDYVKAREYYAKSCNANYARACTRLGFLYGEGKGVEKDIKKANIFFKKACDLKDADGCAISKALNK